MRYIRRGTFETNSSSCHSLTLASKKDYDMWTNGDAFLFYGKFVPINEAYVQIKTWIKEKLDYYAQEGNYWKDEIAMYEGYLNIIDNLDAKTFNDIFKKFITDDCIELNPLEGLFQSIRDDCETFSHQSYLDYYGDEYEMFEQEKNIEGTDVVAFGYYGYS